MNAANMLTLSRLLATPVVLGLMTGNAPATRFAALGVFLLAMLTDVFDGMLARRAGPTLLGTVLDPVADKVLTLCLFFALAECDVLPVWMGLALLAREFVVSGVRAMGARRGRVIGANRMGKTKTFLQTIVIAWALLLYARAALPGAPAARAFGDYPFLYALAAVTTVLAMSFAGVFIYWNRELFHEATAPSAGSAQPEEATPEPPRHT